MTAEEIQKVAEIANAASFIRDFPKGFDTVVGEKGILLSGRSLSCLFKKIFMLLSIKILKFHHFLLPLFSPSCSLP